MESAFPGASRRSVVPTRYGAYSSTQALRRTHAAWHVRGTLGIRLSFRCLLRDESSIVPGQDVMSS